MARTARIAIIGGGIGGLTAAQALLRKGFEVQVYESAPELREIRPGHWVRSAHPASERAAEALVTA